MNYKNYYVWHNSVADVWVAQLGYGIVYQNKHLGQVKRWITLESKKVL